MIFFYHTNSGDNNLKIVDEDFRYLFKARRHKKDDILSLKNFKDNLLYSYVVTELFNKHAILTLKSSKIYRYKKKSIVVLGWFVIDPKEIYKTLPMLNEVGISKICFIYGDYSQKNYKINLPKCNEILKSSNMQSGRGDFMSIDIYSLDEFLNEFENSVFLDISGENSFEYRDINSYIIGCEGGFSPREYEKLKYNKKVSLNSSNIFKSSSATVIVASKILL